MVCSSCGNQLGPNDRFCPYCGTPVQGAGMNQQSQNYGAYQGAGEIPPTFSPEDMPEVPGGWETGFVAPPCEPQQSYGAPQEYAPQQNYGAPQEYAPQQSYGAAQEYAPQQGYAPQQPYPLMQDPASEKPKKEFKMPAIQLPKVDLTGVKGWFAQLPGKLSGLMGKLSGLTGKVGKKGLLIGGGAAAVVIIVLVVALLVTGQPNVKLAAALSNTAGEFTAMLDTVHLTDLVQVLQTEHSSQDLDLGIESVNPDFDRTFAALEGAGIRGQVDMNLDKKVLAASVVPYYGSADLFDISVALRNDILYLGMPELLPEPFYGISTVSGMVDLADLGANVGDLEDVSFNFFDLSKDARKTLEESRKSQTETMQEANKDLLAAVEVEKAGKKSVRVNGKSTKCTVYKVTIPQEAMEDWLDALEDASGEVDYGELAETILEDMNMPSDVTRQVMRELGSSGEVDLEDLYDLVDALGDLELKVYVSANKISMVTFEGELDGTEMEATLAIGGKNGYMDDISLELIVGSEEYLLESSGNHSAKGGSFTDKTTFTVGYRGQTMVEYELNTKYDPKAKDSNLTFSMEYDGEEVIVVEGYYTATGKTLELNLEEITILSPEDGEMMTLRLSWKVFSYKDRITVKDAVLLSDMDEGDVEDLLAEVEENGTAWLEDLLEELPELSYIIGF